MKLITFFQDKKEHYRISDNFIEDYQQLDNNDPNSYITYARETNHLVDPKKHAPNQKWHFFEAYYIYKIVDKYRKNEVYADFIAKKPGCPELLLWMAEAAGIDDDIIEEASRYAIEEIKCIRKDYPNSPYSGKAVNVMEKKLKAKHNKNLWEMLIDKVNLYDKNAGGNK